MGLPDSPIPTEKVETPGGPILVRGLTAGEAAKVSRVVDSGDLATSEITIIAFATDNTKVEAKRWYESNQGGLAKKVIDVAHRLSGLSEEASKSDEGGVADG